jgi:hypothetical protein
VTPRERDPAVWAATYGAGWNDLYRRAYSVADGHPEERHRIALLAIQHAPDLIEMADAAVLALHPEPEQGPFAEVLTLERAARAVCDHVCARPTRDPLSVPACLIDALHQALNARR